MWNLKTSKYKFDQRFPNALMGLAPEVSAIVGTASPGDLSANTTELAEWVRHLNVRNSKASRTSATAYTGVVVSTAALAESGEHKNRTGGWIAISQRYITLCISLSNFFPGYGLMLSALSGRSEADKLRIVAGFRAEAFRYIGRDDLGQHLTYPDDSDVWTRAIDPLFTERTTRAAVQWAAAHELAHIAPDRTETIENRKRCRELLVPIGLWPSTQEQQNEIVCDFAATGYVAASDHGNKDLATTIAGSLIGTLALGLDGWFSDGSAASETHPPPFQRVEALPFFWLERLDDIGKSGWDERTLPDPLGILDFAGLLTYARWFAGQYRDGREGLTMDQDTRHVINLIYLAASLPTAHGAS